MQHLIVTVCLLFSSIIVTDTNENKTTLQGAISQFTVELSLDGNFRIDQGIIELGYMQIEEVNQNRGSRK